MKTNFNKSMIGIALVGLLMVSISACKNDRKDYVRVRTNLGVVNAVEGSSAQDVYVDDTKANTTPVSYGNPATTVSVPTGGATVSFKNAGTSTETASTNLNLSEGGATQTVYLSKLANGSLTVSSYPSESNTPPTTGKAKVRFINLASLLSSTINVTTSTGGAVVSGLSLRASSAYQEVNAATAFNISATGSAEVTTIPAAEIQAGKIYTIWLDSSLGTKVNYHIVAEN
jgi:hypothetical protein